MSNQENPEIVDTEKTIEQLVGEINERVVSLSQEIAELRKGVEEAKALPETQGAKKTLENIKCNSAGCEVGYGSKSDG